MKEKKRHPKKQSLSLLAESFCSHYTAIGTDTFNRKEASAIAAGYTPKSARNRAWGLLSNPDVKKRIQELHRENFSRNDVTVDSVLRDLKNDQEMARSKGDYATATRCTELLGKYLTMFADRQIIVDESRPQIDEALMNQAKRIASVIIDDDLGPEPVRELPEPQLPLPVRNVTDSILVDDESGAEGEGDE